MMKKILKYYPGRKTVRKLQIRIKRKLYPPDPNSRYLNIGGGNWYHPRWENIDHYVDPFYIDYKVDLRLKSPIELPANCAKLIFSSHILEHLSDEDCLFILEDSYRLLQQGGYVRISVPDMEKALKAYKESDNHFFDQGGVTCIGNSLERKLVNFFASYRTSDGYSGGPIVSDEIVREKLQSLNKYEFVHWCVEKIPQNATYKAHINGFDFAKLKKFLSQTGFRKIEKSSYKSSTVPELRHNNFDNKPMVSLYVEAQKKKDIF